MDFKIIFIIFVIFVISGCTSAHKSKKEYSPIQYLKNYALCTCIADGFESKEVINDAAAGARGYLEFGDLPLDAYTQATLLGQNFLKREYKSLTGQKLTLMKCIDFYNSKELDELARHYINKKK